MHFILFLDMIRKMIWKIRGECGSGLEKKSFILRFKSNLGNKKKSLCKIYSVSLGVAGCSGSFCKQFNKPTGLWQITNHQDFEGFSYWWKTKIFKLQKRNNLLNDSLTKKLSKLVIISSFGMIIMKKMRWAWNESWRINN